MAKWRLVNSPTERTTAGTDILLALVAIGAALSLVVINANDAGKAVLWSTTFGALAVAASLGAMVHGLQLPQRVKIWLWGVIYVALSGVVAMFAVGAAYDFWGSVAAWRLLPLMLGASLLFLAVTVIGSGSYAWFVAYHTLALLGALLGYLWLAVNAQLAGGWWMVAGIALTLVAAAIQSSGRVRLVAGWQFDHNGVYHLVQTVALIFLWLGLRTALLTGPV